MIELYTVNLCGNGDKYWYLNGKLHRTDGPAIERASGTKFWYLHGKRHRTDGPAVEWADGTNKWWYLYGKLHRTDGPAVEWADGTKWWYLDDKRVTKADVMGATCNGKTVEIDGVKYKLVREASHD